MILGIWEYLFHFSLCWLIICVIFHVRYKNLVIRSLVFLDRCWKVVENLHGMIVNQLIYLPVVMSKNFWYFKIVFCIYSKEKKTPCWKKASRSNFRILKIFYWMKTLLNSPVLFRLFVFKNRKDVLDFLHSDDKENKHLESL